MVTFKRKFLSVSDIIAANKFPTGSGVPYGIIPKIKEIFSSNIISYVEPSAGNYNYIEGNYKTLVNWNNYV